MAVYTRRPEWLKLPRLDMKVLDRMMKLTRGLRLHTVCENAQCPNRAKCFAEGTAAFLVLGNMCTRNCTFCAMGQGELMPPDPEEPAQLVEAVHRLGLNYVVVTSVTRDDLPDGGASHFARIIRALHSYDLNIKVEVLIPDFQGSATALKTVVDARPDVLNHNIETVPRLYAEVRPQALYVRSIELLRQAKAMDSKLFTKSGLMVGLGEYPAEVMGAMDDLRQVGCDILTVGQYLPPSLGHHELARYVTLGEFDEYEHTGSQKGFLATFAGPLVRSSFHAGEIYLSARQRLS